MHPGVEAPTPGAAQDRLRGRGRTWHSGPPLSRVEVYDPATDAWEKRADMPGPRQTAGLGVVDGKIYVIGGWLPGDVGLSTVEVYDPAMDKWERKSDMPTARPAFGVSVVGGRIYAIGHDLECY